MKSEAPHEKPRNLRGRPRLSSRETLEEAAYELFLENGYAHTTAADIATRAGVSRGTFFNYFSSKADVFWVDLDASLDRLPDACAAIDAESCASGAVSEALISWSEEFGPQRVPWILTQFEAIGSPGEVRGAATERFIDVASVLEHFITGRSHASVDRGTARALAYAALGATFAAAQEWAEAGQQRGNLSTYVARSIAAVRTCSECSGEEPQRSDAPR